MESALINSIGTSIKKAVSGSTSHVHFLFLPDKKLLDRLTIVYEINNSDNLDSFDVREFGKTMRLEVKINSPTIPLMGNTSTLISGAIYNLQGTAFKIAHKTDDETFYDEDLKIWTHYMRYELS